MCAVGRQAIDIINDITRLGDHYKAPRFAAIPHRHDFGIGDALGGESAPQGIKSACALRFIKRFRRFTVQARGATGRARQKR